MSRSRKDGRRGGAHKGWAQNWKEFWSSRPMSMVRGSKWVKTVTHRLERHGKIAARFMRDAQEE